MGSRAYVLLTDHAATSLQVSSEAAIRLTERYEHLEPIEALLYPMPMRGGQTILGMLYLGIEAQRLR